MAHVHEPDRAHSDDGEREHLGGGRTAAGANNHLFDYHYHSDNKKIIYHRSVLDSNQSYHDTVLGATHRGLQSEGTAKVDPSSHGERVRYFSSLRSYSLQITKKTSPAQTGLKSEDI